LIVYVSGLRPDLLDEASGKLFMIVTRVQTDHLKKLVIGSAADFSHASRFVVDLSALKDTTGEVIEALSAFRAMYADTRVIVMAYREPEGSPIFSHLYDMRIYDVVTELDGDALKRCLTTGTTREEAEAYRAAKPELTAHARDNSPVPTETRPESLIDTAVVASEPPPAREKITANRDFKRHKQFVTVAVCATEPHMGATHNALLIAKFLCGTGFKACYLEANERRNIFFLARAYPVNANERRHLLQFEGVDMYFDFKLPEVVAADYDFLVFDFGRFGEFEPASFLTKDIGLVVGGAKAWEMPAYSAVFEAVEGSRDVRFIMNHAPPNEHSNIRSLMGGYKTHFAGYAPYPFASGVNLDIYKDIFGDYLNVELIQLAPAPERPGRKRFFGSR
jgi:hypothetical protein